MYLTGWRECFHQAETPGAFRDLDGWVRHRLRCLQLKQWKRGKTVYREDADPHWQTAAAPYPDYRIASIGESLAARRAG